MGLIIKKAAPEDFDNIWEIFHAVVSRGDTYTFDPAISKEEARAIWMSPQAWTYVATIDGGEVIGTYFMRANQPGLGSHVVNAGYMVKPEAQGRGIGRAMCEHSLAEARALGFLAMQYNIVVSTNEAAVALWKKMGFQIVGTLPKAFRHRELGLVDAFVMHRFLTGE
jgi:L-amino acid N-acyltransferase YncA